MYLGELIESENEFQSGFKYQTLHLFAYIYTLICLYNDFLNSVFT